MSDEGNHKRYRSRHKPAVPEPTARGLKCPACGCNTVQRDVSPEDHWFVEFCLGGQIKVATKVNGRTVEDAVDCEYFGVGFEGGRRY